MKIIKNVNMVLSDRIIKGSIAFSNKIESIQHNQGSIEHVEGVESKIESIQHNNESIWHKLEVDRAEEIDGSGMYLTPGFIDIHVHGAGGYDTMDTTPQAINEISKKLIQSGVCSFLPTTMTMPVNDIRAALESIKRAEKSGTQGARVLGANVEGPFISQQYKGAQKADYIIDAKIELIKDYLDLIKIVTIAPEIEGAEEFIKYLKGYGIIVSAGHSAATYQELTAAKEWGISHITHLFNAMTGLHHRKPGIVGAALEKDFTCELIVDFIHLHPAVLKVVFKAKKMEEIILVTDQMRAGSMEDGIYDLGSQNVIVKNGEARLEDGQLAGSVLTLDRALRNMQSLNILTLPQIISLLTINPARLLGLDKQMGKLAPGYMADLVLLDKDLIVKRVFRDGQEIIVD